MFIQLLFEFEYKLASVKNNATRHNV